MVGTAPVIQRKYFNNFVERLRGSRFELELVLESELVAAIERNYGKEFESLLEFDTVDVYVTDEAFPYALWLIERLEGEHAGITVYENGGLNGTIVNDTHAAVAWAKARYCEYLESASKLTQFPS